MAKIQVTVSELTAAANTLTDLNNNFRTKVTELGSLESELGAMWQGDANNAFRTAFNNDRDQWNTFAQIIDQYIQALLSTANRYANAEDTTTSIAKNRTY